MSGFSVQIRTGSFFMGLSKEMLIKLFSNYGKVAVFTMASSDSEVIAIAKYKNVK